MRKIILLSAAVVLAGIQPVFAEDAAAPAAHAEHAQHESGQETPESGWLKHAEAKHVCMMNDKAFDKEQMAIEIDGKTYYGCCPMCKEMLSNDPAKRAANDPVSGKTVDKATAIIGEHNGMVYYFENEENFQKFASGPMPEMHEHMGDMHGHMEGMDHGSGGATKAPAAPENHEEHH